MLPMDDQVSNVRFEAVSTSVLLNSANDDEGHPDQHEFKVTTWQPSQNRTYRDYLNTYHMATVTAIKHITKWIK